MASKNDIKIPGLALFTSTWHHVPYNAISPFRPELSVAGQAIVITGGGTGIGKAIAKAFAQASASSIAILGRRVDRLQAAVEDIKSTVGKEEVTLLYESVDLTDRRATQKALADIVQKQGRKIDIFVSNAGDLAPPGRVLEADEDDIMRGFEYNVRLPLNAIHAFIPHAAQGAKVLNISSGIAHMSPIPGLSAHGMSKAAGVKLVDYIQAENPDLHTVNVQPGSVKTEMSMKAGTGDQVKDDVNLPGHFCVWLASQEAKFLKGKFVWANWDVRELMERADEIRSSRFLLNVTLEGVPM